MVAILSPTLKAMRSNRTGRTKRKVLETVDFQALFLFFVYFTIRQKWHM